MKQKKRSNSPRKGTINNSFTDQFQAYLHVHAHALFSSLGRLVRNPFTTSMTIIVMAIAISLASVFYLFVANMQQLTRNVELTNQISLFLKPGISLASSKKLVEKIRKNGNVEHVILIPSEQGLEEFKTYSGFGDVLSVLDSNPLPAVIQVLPADSLDGMQRIKKLMWEFKTFSQVEFVKMDMQWMQRLHSIMQIIERGVFLLTLLLGLAVLLITGNTIRLELQNRRDEVLVAKLVGATHSFVQRPFLYTGFWLGIISGFLAWVLVLLMMLLIEEPVIRLSELYNGAFEINYLTFVESVLLLFISAFLGVIGAWVVLRCQLHQIKPR
jgi:cell division transport system permease protein